MSSFPEIKEGLVIRPGDTVLFTLPDTHEINTPEKVEDYMRRLRDALPENVHVTLIVGTQVSVIRREEDPAYAAGEETGWHRGFGTARRYPKGESA